MEPLRTADGYFLACGRNLYNHSGQVELSLSRYRQARQDGGFSASAGSRHRRCTGILSQSSIDEFAARKITLDGHLQSHMALRLLRREDPKWKYVEVRSNQYLNNIIEQDHRAIKRRCAAMGGGGFKSFGSAAITLAGIELAHRIRKRQFSFGRGRYQNFGSLKQIWDRALA
jgi:hypothetical protein